MLLDSCDLSPIGQMNSRVVMAAMTRNFAPGHLANDAIADYYGKRAEDGVGLILTEGTVIHSTADGYRDVPHIETMAQAESWAPTLDRVHAAGGKIFSQLWHCGRISHSDFTGGVPPVSSTNEAAAGHNRQNDKPFGEPRALETDEMATIYAQYVTAAKNALAVGFDGVQLHMGHGYLVDQFFDARVNDRTDKYGGSVENRCRFGLEMVEEVLGAVDPNRVMIRISPSRFMGEIYNWPDMDEMVDYLIPALKGLGLKMLDISCANADYTQTSQPVIHRVRDMWDGLMIGGASLTKDAAEAEIEGGHLDMVTFGRALIANPDLVSRFKSGADLAPFDFSLLGTLD